MEAKDLFTLALQLSPEGKVTACELDQPAHRLTLELDFKAGRRFCAPGTTHQLLLPVRDTVQKTWSHLDFFQYQTELVTPGAARQNARGQGGADRGALGAAGQRLYLDDGSLDDALVWGDARGGRRASCWGRATRGSGGWLAHYVEAARVRRDWSQVRRILIDETSARKGHRCVTSVVDADTHELLFLTEGREADTVAAFVAELRAHGGVPEQIELVSMDMSPAYRQGAREHLPAARVVFDHFHLMAMAGKALDEVRKELRREGADLAGGLWALRGNAWTRTPEQSALRVQLGRTYPKLRRAMMLPESRQDVLSCEDPAALRWWVTRARRARLAPFRRLADSIMEPVTRQVPASRPGFPSRDVHGETKHAFSGEEYLHQLRLSDRQ